MFIGKFNKSVIITYLGVLSTMLGIYFILGSEKTYLGYAIICLIVAGVCDLFDGKVARMIKNRTDHDVKYGIQIDSLTDMISFIAFPIIILYGYSKEFNISLLPFISVPVLTLFVVAGISRLSYFNVQADEEKGPLMYYTGLPVTSTAVIIPVFYLLRYPLSSNLNLFVTINLIVFALTAFFMIFRFKLKKIKNNWWYIACSLSAIIGILILVLLNLDVI